MSTISVTQALVDELSKCLVIARVRGQSAFVSAGVSYPNGVATMTRIDSGRHGFTVSDDGYASFIAESMSAARGHARVAPDVAKLAGIGYERGTFFVDGVDKQSLPTAVVAVSNASARSVERLLAALEKTRYRKSRETFDARLREAFGPKVSFDVEFRGATGRAWEFSAGVTESRVLVSLFELVSPSTQSVAIANLKISDARAMIDAPSITAALVDYDRTDPALRSLLSTSATSVISANDEVSQYLLAAA